MKKLFSALLLLLCVSLTGMAQYTSLNAHSHNDYEQKTPFFLAYNAHFGSIEADIWAVDGELFVAHARNKITPEKTMDQLYIQPIVTLFKQNNGQAWTNSKATFQLLIDLKTGTEPTLSLLVEKLKKYPEVFDPSLNKNAVRVTITGNRPDPSKFSNYPSFIFFDGNISLKYDAEQLKRVGIYSENLGKYTFWKGLEAIPAKEELRLKQIIDSVHSIKKMIRFWNAPDMPEAWIKLMSLKVDYINTDHIPELASFLKSAKN
ncbi:MAG TPA: phosphatidylinositol-specific phospholipase C/glycerophosphodiester phosphodiesterase family protein [Prolixibacteraceae bacterium]